MIEPKNYIPLAKYAIRLPSRDLLVGLRVWDSIWEQHVYIQSTDLFCTPSKDGELGNYYSWHDLYIDPEQEAD